MEAVDAVLVAVDPKGDDMVEVKRPEEEAAAKAKLPEVPAEQGKREGSAPRKAPPTPKRPRSKDEEDVAMADGESPESKKRRTEAASAAQ